MSAPALPDRDALHRSIDSVWRIEAARIIACVARMTRDVGRAEELAQDALVAALEHWPQDGLPANPAAWLMTTAKRRAIDHLRQQALHQRENEALGHDLEALEAQVAPDVVDTLMHAEQDDIGVSSLRSGLRSGERIDGALIAIGLGSFLHLLDEHARGHSRSA